MPELPNTNASQPTPQPSQGAPSQPPAAAKPPDEPGPALNSTPPQAEAPAAQPSIHPSNPSIPGSGASCQRLPGETPRAFSAFVAFCQLGHVRSLQALADKLGENFGTVRNWASKFDWNERLQALNSGLLQQQADAQTRQATAWAQRLNDLRQQEWDTAQKLLVPILCFLETFGEEDLHKLTLAQVSRALRAFSQTSRSAIAVAQLPASAEPAAAASIPPQLRDMLQRVYGEPPAAPGPAPAPPAFPPHTP